MRYCGGRKAYSRNWRTVELLHRPDREYAYVPPELRITGQAAATVLLMRLIKSMEPVSEEEAKARWKELACQLRGRQVGNASVVHLNYVDINNLCQESRCEV